MTNNELVRQLQQLPTVIRQPAVADQLPSIEPRRIKIYQELFYNNIEGFISSGFPVLRSLYSEECWHTLIREFMVAYRCSTPYFLAISQEFIHFLQQRSPDRYELPFMLELAHYEWVELALETDQHDLALMPYDKKKDLLDNLPVVSPLAWPLNYQFPVHQISRDYQPIQAPEQPSFLIVYRNRADQVRFMESNAATCRLLAILQLKSTQTGRQALQQLAQEMGYKSHNELLGSGLSILQQLLEIDILLGV